MLNNVSRVANAIKPRPRFGMPALWTELGRTGVPGISLRDDIRIARPSTDLPAVAVKKQSRAHVPSALAALSLTAQVSYTTRILAGGEGALGPHPAREPEPV